MNNNTQDVWEINNLPNRLTIFRILLIPIIILCLSLAYPDIEVTANYHRLLCWIATFIFIIASFTDFVDGYIARKHKLVTVFGSFLDPIADKFLIISTLIMLQGLNRIPPIIVIILVLREIYITALRLLAAERGLSVPVEKLGKWKTAFQMIAVGFLLAYDTPWGIPMPLIGTILIYIASLLSIISATSYSWGLIKKIRLAKLTRKQKSATLQRK